MNLMQNNTNKKNCKLIYLMINANVYFLKQSNLTHAEWSMQRTVCVN